MNEFVPMKTTMHFSTASALWVMLVAAATTGCSTFNSDWKKARATPPGDDVTGRWEGSWLSGKNGHHGRLRCVVTRLGDDRYRAHYKATYWKIFRIGYAVDMQVRQESSNTYKFQGETDLGWWGGGVYHYDGDATPANFFSTYKSKYDHGTFQMTRP